MLRLNDALFYHMVSSDSHDQRCEAFSLGLDSDDLRGSNSARQCQLSRNSTAYLFNLSIFYSQCLRNSFNFCVGRKCRHCDFGVIQKQGLCRDRHSGCEGAICCGVEIRVFRL